MTEIRPRTRTGGALTAIYGMARLSENDVGKLALSVQDCKEIVLEMSRSRMEEHHSGWEDGFQEAMDIVRAKPWYKRIFT